MSVARAQREINSREFSEWIEFEDIDPCEETREDYRSAQLALLMVDVQRDSRDRRANPLSIEDFRIKFRPRDKPLEKVTVSTAAEIQLKFAPLMALAREKGKSK